MTDDNPTGTTTPENATPENATHPRERKPVDVVVGDTVRSMRGTEVVSERPLEQSTPTPTPDAPPSPDVPPPPASQQPEPTPPRGEATP